MKNKKIYLFFPAVIFILFACSEQGDPKTLFEQGEYEQAYRHWLPVAEQGDPVAQNYLAIQNYLGLGVPRNYKMAKEWFEKAAKNGLADAQYNLGVMYENGDYVDQDYVTAYMWLYIANKNSNPHAARRMQGIADEHKLFPNQMMRAETLAKEYIK